MWPFPLSLAESSLSTKNPWLASHTLTVLSNEPAAISFPSGEAATVVTPSSILRVSEHWPVNTSQILTVLSPEPETSLEPSGKKSNEYMSCSCPFKYFTIVLVARSQILMILSSAPVARNFPSGEKQTDLIYKSPVSVSYDPLELADDSSLNLATRSPVSTLKT
ncbi:hypothetical protein OGATHE_002494 [Ogataea polymorpha]|uniref:Uncharacterized protein n=1 Tax=Ogataea polymorpha TaxID=460523 RepID=A0A9P8PD61_9ASCO|nr:hypothetical protein OGATHE_002494 [Ogataea polymorpha]